MKKYLRFDAFLKKVEEEYRIEENRNLGVYVKKGPWVQDTIQNCFMAHDNGRGNIIMIGSSLTDHNTITLEDIYNSLKEIDSKGVIFKSSPVVINWLGHPYDFYKEEDRYVLVEDE